MTIDKDILKEVEKIINEVLDSKTDSIVENMGNKIRSLKKQLEDINGFDSEKLIDSLNKLEEYKRKIAYWQAREAKALKEGRIADAESFKLKKEGYQKDAELVKEIALDEHENLLKTKEGLTKIDEVFNKIDNKTYAIKKGFKDIGEGAKQIGTSVNNLIKPWAKASQEAANYAKAIGMSGKAMDALLKTTTKAAVQGKIGINFNYSSDELLKLQSGYAQELGRNIGVNNQGVANLAATSRVMGEENAKNLFTQLDNFGLSLNDASELAGRMYAKAAKSGISMEKYSKNFLTNIKLAQTYTFKDGLAGLERMAKKATEMKLDMGQVAAFANKVNSVEGAITTGAKLQVLGGTFTAGANPLQMLYEGTSNLEGLMDRMVNMFGGLGSFNKNTNQVEISAFNKLRIQQASEAMGLDYSNVMESVTNNARRNEIAKQLSGMGMDKELIDLIKNVGTIEKGVAGANIGGKFISANELKSGKYNEELVQLNRTESENIQDIAISVRGMEEIMSGVNKEKENKQADMFSGIGNGVKKIVSKIGRLEWVITAWAALAGVKAIGGVGNGVRSIVQGTARVGKGIGNLLTKGGGAGARGIISGISKIGGILTKGLGAAGPIGLGIATVVGAALAINKHMREKWGNVIQDKTGVQLRGYYIGVNTKRIGQAVSDDGHMSYYEFRQLPKHVQKKMIRNGDAAQFGLKVARGGYISGEGTSTSDSIHAMLSNGESVMSAAATSKYGPMLSAMNQSVGGAPIIVPRKFSRGGTAVVAPINPSESINPRLNNGNLDVNYGGEVNVKFPNGLSKTLEREFLNDNQFINSMVKMISEGINRRNQGGAYKVTKAFSNMR